MSLTNAQLKTNDMPIRKKHIKLEIMDFDFKIEDEIVADCIGGSLSKDANSPLRRSGNIQIAIPTYEQAINLQNKLDGYKIELGGKIWLDKYIKISIGIEEYDNAYYRVQEISNSVFSSSPIVWNTFGICLIDAPVRTYSGSQYELSFNAIDLMAKLTGDRQGQLTGIGTVIKQGTYDNSTTPPTYVPTYTRDALYSVLSELGNVKNISIAEIPLKYRYLPYDIKVETGATVYNLISKFMDILTTWQIYFDNDGCLIVEPIPTGQQDFVFPLNPEYIITNTINTDFRNVKNQIVVYGRTNSVDFLAYKIQNTLEDGEEVLNLYFETLDWSKVEVQTTKFGFENTTGYNIDNITKVRFYVAETEFLFADLKSFEGGDDGIKANELIPYELYFIRILSGTVSLAWSGVYDSTIRGDNLLITDDTQQHTYLLTVYQLGDGYLDKYPLYEYIDNEFVFQQYINTQRFPPIDDSTNRPQLPFRIESLLCAHEDRIFAHCRDNNGQNFIGVINRNISTLETYSRVINADDGEPNCAIVQFVGSSNTPQLLFGTTFALFRFYNWIDMTNAPIPVSTTYGYNIRSLYPYSADIVYCGVGAGGVPESEYFVKPEIWKLQGTFSWQKVADFENNIWEIVLIRSFNNNLFAVSSGGGVFCLNADGSTETINSDPDSSDRTFEYVSNIAFGSGLYLVGNIRAQGAAFYDIAIYGWDMQTKSPIYSETFDQCPLEADVIGVGVSDNDLLFMDNEGNYTLAQFSGVDKDGCTFDFRGKVQVSATVVDDNIDSPFYLNANLKGQNYYCGFAYSLGIGAKKIYQLSLTEVSTPPSGVSDFETYFNGATFAFMADIDNYSGQYIRVVDNNGRILLNDTPLRQSNAPIVANKLSNDYTIWLIKFYKVSSGNYFNLIGKHPYALTLVCTGGEYDNIYADQLAYERGLYERYLHSNLNNTISLGMVPNYALDVNMKIPYKESWFETTNDGDDDTEYYLIKNINYPLTISNTPQSLTAMQIYDSGNLFGEDN